MIKKVATQWNLTNYTDGYAGNNQIRCNNQSNKTANICFTIRSADKGINNSNKIQKVNK